MSSTTKTNIELYDEYYENLFKKHPDTLYSLDPAEREEEMKNAPVLSIEDLKVVLERPLPEDASPENLELHEACKEFLYGTLIPNEEFLKRLEAGEFDDPEDSGEDGFEEDSFGHAEIPTLIENEEDYGWML